MPLTILLICISLITYGVEYLFICLLAISTPFLVMYLLKSLAYFLNLVWLLVFLLSFKSSLYIFSKNSLQLFSPCPLMAAKSLILSQLCYSHDFSLRLKNELFLLGLCCLIWYPPATCGYFNLN